MTSKTINEFKKFLAKITKKSFFSVHEPDLKKSDYKLLKKCIEKNEVSASGSLEKKLEEKIKKLTKAKYVIFTNSGTSALHISCILSGIKHNDEVIMPAFTFVASANAVKYCNGLPHFVDIEPKNFTIDTEKLSKYLQKILIKRKNHFINKKTKNIVKAIMPVHPYGHPCDMRTIKKIALKYKLKIIEDAADALGSYYYGRHVGTFGDFGVLSFNGNKIVTAGAGGAILTNNKFLAKKSKNLVCVAKNPHPYKMTYNDIGYNYRIPNINAALLLSQLTRFKSIIGKKRKLFEKYKFFFKNKKNFKLVNEPQNSKSSYWLQTIIIENLNNMKIEKLIKQFIKNKIFVRAGWELIPKLKPFRNCPKMNLKTAIKIQPKIINLPSSSFLIN